MNDIRQSNLLTTLTRPLFSGPEAIAFDQLNAAVHQWALEVFPKVRVADVLPIDRSGIDSEHYSYALKAHFDFVVYRVGTWPEFAVEFDGPTHRDPIQRARDKKKNALCKYFRFPLLRIKQDHISRKFGDLTVLGWIVDVYQMKLGFDEAQAKGQIPPEESFDPLYLSVSTKPNSMFPYWISRHAQTEVKRLFEEGRLAVPGTSGFIGLDKNGVMRGIEYVPVTYTQGLFAKSAMMAQDFPVPYPDLLGEILRILLYEKLQRHFSGSEPLRSIDRIEAIAASMRARDRLVIAHHTRAGSICSLQRHA